MIVSVHLPKTAGNSLKEALKREFKDRLLLDYEDWAGYRSPESDARTAANAVEMRSRRDELLGRFDAIHGHFIADKYVGLFPDTHFVAFFRDPFQQTVSQYRFLLRIPHAREHPAVRILHDEKMTLQDFIIWEATKNPQTQCVGAVAIEDFAMVGLVEEYPRSIRLFRAVFGRVLSSDIFENVNPVRSEAGYPIDAELRKIIEIHRAADIDLYRRARELFARQAGRRVV
jgi:hypothetical protein